MITQKTKQYDDKEAAQKVIDRLTKADPSKVFDLVEENGKFHVLYVKPVSDQEPEQEVVEEPKNFDNVIAAAQADADATGETQFIGGVIVAEPAHPMTPKLTKTKSTPKKAVPVSQGDEQVYRLHVVGAHLTEVYVITPPIGTSKKGPLERWIERGQCVGVAEKNGGVEITARMHVFESRGISEGLKLVN